MAGHGGFEEADIEGVHFTIVADGQGRYPHRYSANANCISRVF